MAITYDAPTDTITIDDLLGQTWADIYAADVAGAWGQVTEVVAGRMYYCEANLNVGAGTNATSMVSINEAIYFEQTKEVSVKVNGTLTIGAASGDWSINGSFWGLGGTGNAALITDGGDMNVYGSRLHNWATATRQQFSTGGDVVIKNSILSAEWVENSSVQNQWTVASSVNSISLEDVIVSNVRSFQLNITPSLMSDIRIHETGLGLNSNRTVSCDRTLSTKYTTNDFRITYANPAVLTVLNPIAPVTAPNCVQNGNDIKEDYTIQVNVKDSLGNALAGAVVDCYDKDGTAQWAVGTISTDASGDIAQQQVTHEMWEDAADTHTTFSPFKFILTKPGYLTLTIDKQTLDEPIDWRVEMQNMPKRYGERLYMEC